MRAEKLGMSETVLCPTCNAEADHLLGRLYRCNACKAFVRNWPQPDSASMNGMTPSEENPSTS